jgi:ASPM-SPD-2-Hydin domain-containing protein/centrosomal CEP192-like protein
MYVIKMRPVPVRKFRQHFNSCQSRASRYSSFFAFLVLCLSSLGVSGCGGIVVLSGTKSNSADVTLVATPAVVDFGSVGIGNSNNQKVSLTNKGSDSVQISQLSLTNTQFAVDGEGRLPVTLAAGTSLSLNIHFSPKNDLDSSDQLNVITSSSSEAAAAIKLHGKGALGSAEVSGFTCDQASMSGAGSDSCTIAVSMAAPSAGLQVNLSSNSSAIKVPASVKVLAGSSSVKFAATISNVSSDETGVITASQGSIAKSFSISLSAGAAIAGASQLNSLSCVNTSFTGAGKTACTATLNAKTSKALAVAIASTSSAVTVPVTVTIPAGSSTASFTANVAPVATAQTATISANVNGTSRNVPIQLKPSKTTTSAPALSLSISSMQFGDVAVGTAVTKSITVTSTGNVPLTIKSNTITGTGFSLSGVSVPMTLKPAQATVLTVHFNPTAAGSVAGQLVLVSNAGTQAVSVTGNGTTATPTLSALTCGSASIVGTLADSCKVTLSGSAPKPGVTVALASSSTNVKVPASITIPGTATTATFTANAAAVSTAQTVKLTATIGSATRSISLQLSPALAQLSVDATAISFGSVILNQTTTQIVTLSSVGKAAVTVKSVLISGTGFSLSSVSLPATLNPGQKLVLTLVYKATATGSQQGLLTISSNSSTNPTVTINLNATTSGHRVELNWNPPAASSNPVSGFRVYRATGSAGSFAKLASTGPPSYTDTNVQSGNTYKYYITSLGSSGGESAPSNTFTATIP